MSPIPAPTANMMIITISNDLTAFIINSYFPMSNSMKLPDIPGKIIAQIAMAPHMKIKSKESGVCAGVAIVI